MTHGASRWVFASLVLVLSLVFARLGVWQLDRHRERQEENAVKRGRLAREPLRLGDGGPTVPELPPAESLAWRRVELAGRYDYGRELLLGARSYEGNPGVYLLTPLRLGGREAVLVLRGWLPAPDGFHAPLERGRPAKLRGRHGEDRAGEQGLVGDRVRVEGLAMAPEGRAGAVVDTLQAGGGGHPVLDAPDLDLVRRLLPFRLPDFYVQAVVPGATDEAAGGAVPLPRPLPRPRLDGGPHLAYALQWFAFAAIALVGGAIYLWRRPASA